MSFAAAIDFKCLNPRESDDTVPGEMTTAFGVTPSAKLLMRQQDCGSCGDFRLNRESIGDFG
jgi:hypothetical protein